MKCRSVYIVGGMLMLSFASCKVTTEAVKPDLPLPAAYTNSEADTSNISSLPWKVFYKDTCLTRLIAISLAHNPDLQMASDRSRLAHTDYQRVSKNFLPGIGMQVGNTLKKFGEYTMDDVGNDDTNKSDGVSPDKRIPEPYTEWFAGLVFNWEADIWGKLANGRKAAVARYLASNEFRHGINTWLISEVATHYYELIGLDQEKKVLLENLQLQELGLELIQIQKAGGKVNQLAVDQFEAQLLNIKTRLVDTDQKIRVTEAKINQLLGRFPQSLKRDSISGYDGLALPSIGKPSHLLANRPDIREAELELTAAHADIAAARAAFYPSLGFSGAAGFSAFDISKWFLMPGSAAYALASSISAPLFQRRQIRALYEGAGYKERMALKNYEKTLLTGFHEVYTAISGFNNSGRQIELKKQEAEVLRRAFNNSNDLFSVGYATYLEVITAQRRMLEVELELTHLKKERLKGLAVLYRALGGGWQQ